MYQQFRSLTGVVIFISWQDTTKMFVYGIYLYWRPAD